MRGIAGIVIGFLIACVTPSVPIPPPEADAIVFELDVGAGTARYQADSNTSYAGARVYVFNRDRGAGVITVAADDGSVAQTAPFAAQEGDSVVITYELDDQAAAICLTMRDGRSSPQFECSL